MGTPKHFQSKKFLFFGKRHLYRLLAGLSFLGFFSSCNASQDEGLFLLPNLSPHPRFSWDYKGIILNQNGLSTERSEEPFSSLPSSLEIQAGLLGFYETPQGLCIYSQPRDWFLRERGLRLRYCSEKLNQRAQILYNLLFQQSEGKPANPSYFSAELDIFYTRLKSWRQSLKSPHILIDAGDSFDTSLSKLLPSGVGRLEWQAAFLPQFQKAGVFPIGRRFARASFHLLLEKDSVHLIYPSRQHKGEVLVLRFKDPFFVEASKSALSALRNILETDQSTKEQSSRLKVVEYYTGKLEESYLVIKNTGKTGFLPLRIDFGNGDFLETKVFLLSNTQLLLSRKNVFKFRLLPSFRVQGQSFATTSPSGRAVLWEEGRQAFLFSPHCLQSHQGICGRAGIEERLLAWIESRLGAQSCRTSDLLLGEFNPKGLYNGKAILQDGKFLEFELLQNCRLDAMDLRFGSHRLPLSHGSLPQGRRLLLTGNPNYFQKTKNTIFIRNIVLRYLKAEDTIEIKDLYRNKSINLYTKPPLMQILMQWGADAPLYSIQPIQGGLHIEHTNKESCGLRPDLLPYNRMTPACDSVPVTTTRQAYLSEIFPAGAKDNSKKSLPDEEFIEFAFQENPKGVRQASSLRLEIADRAGNLVQEILLPPFLPNTHSYQTLSRKASSCFADAGVRGVLPKLRLPDFGLSLFLKEASGRPLDSLQIPAWQSASFRGTPRRSLQRIPLGSLFSANQPWLFSTSQPQNLDCHLHSQASPGKAGSWKARFYFSGPYQPFAVDPNPAELPKESFQTFAATFLGTQAQQIHLEWISETSQTIAYNELEFSFRETRDFFAKGGGGRELVLLSMQGIVEAAVELWPKAPKLLFQSIAPSPAAGEQEWIRICSEGGFLLSSEETLHLRDRTSTDRIVPWNNRKARLPQGLSLLRGDTLQLPAGKCALLLDPDTILWSHKLLPRDLLLWTVESSATLGNSLSSAEPLLLEARLKKQTRILASYGLRDAPQELRFGLPTKINECVERKPKSLRDRKENYEVQKCK